MPPMPITTQCMFPSTSCPKKKRQAAARTKSNVFHSPWTLVPQQKLNVAKEIVKQIITNSNVLEARKPRPRMGSAVTISGRAIQWMAHAIDAHAPILSRIAGGCLLEGNCAILLDISRSITQPSCESQTPYSNYCSDSIPPQSSRFLSQLFRPPNTPLHHLKYSAFRGAH